MDPSPAWRRASGAAIVLLVALATVPGVALAENGEGCRRRPTASLSPAGRGVVKD